MIMWQILPSALKVIVALTETFINMNLVLPRITHLSPSAVAESSQVPEGGVFLRY